MSPERILFRADASHAIGFGHVTRMCALIEEASDAGFAPVAMFGGDLPAIARWAAGRNLPLDLRAWSTEHTARAAAAPDVRAVFVDGQHYRLLVMINEETAEVKYWITNALDQPLDRIVRAAFRRATVEHGFRLAKTEIGLTHCEGRTYVGLTRHLILSLVVMGFVAEHTQRLRKKKSPSPRDPRTSLPHAHRRPRQDDPPSPRHRPHPAHRHYHPLPPTPQRRRPNLPQKTAA